MDDYADWLDGLYACIKRLKDDNINEIAVLSERHKLGKETFEYVKESIADLKKENDRLESQQSKIARFLDTYEEIDWVHDLKQNDSQFGDRIVFKPVEISPFTEKLIFNYANKHLFMSATILSKSNFCRNLGINPEDAYFLKVPSTFPVYNRPTYKMNSGPLTMKKKEESMPHIVSDIEEILSQFVV